MGGTAAALQERNIEIVTDDGRHIRGLVRSMKTTQALTTPSVKIETADGSIVKTPFPSIVEIVDHNRTAEVIRVMDSNDGKE